MILNQYLSEEELKKTFTDSEWDSLKWVLSAFLPSESKAEELTKNPELLGRIHHSANLDKYPKPDFRKNLLQKAPEPVRQQYFKHCGITDEEISKMTFEQKLKRIDELGGFDWGDNERTRKFLDFFEYPDYLIPDEALGIKTHEIIYGDDKNYQEEKFNPLKMLYGYQSSIVYRTLKEIEEPNRPCLIQMPTGTGKTRTAMEVLSFLFNENPEIRIIWLTNKKELLEQARNAFVEVWNHVGKVPIEVFNIWGTTEKIPTIPQTKVLVFASYGKLNNLLEKGLELKSDYVFVDEAHQILAPTYKAAVRKVSSTSENETRVIGLTATPGRGIDETQNIRLVDEFQNNIQGIEFYGDDKKIYEKKPLQYLEDQGILAKTIPEQLRTEYELDIPEDKWKGLAELSITTGDRNEFDEGYFIEMANNNARNIAIIRKLKELAEAGKKVLYFSTTKKQSLFIFTVLQMLGVKAIHVAAETEPVFRRQIVNKFRDTDEISIICNYEIFSAGLDIPKLDVVFIARPVNSPVLFNQMVGRGTRGPKMGGTKTHTLIQVIDGKPSRFIDFDPYENYGFWDDDWKK